MVLKKIKRRRRVMETTCLARVLPGVDTPSFLSPDRRKPYKVESDLCTQACSINFNDLTAGTTHPRAPYQFEISHKKTRDNGRKDRYIHHVDVPDCFLRYFSFSFCFKRKCVMLSMRALQRSSLRARQSSHRPEINLRFGVQLPLR